MAKAAGRNATRVSMGSIRAMTTRAVTIELRNGTIDTDLNAVRDRPSTSSLKRLTVSPTLGASASGGDSSIFPKRLPWSMALKRLAANRPCRM